MTDSEKLHAASERFRPEDLERRRDVKQKLKRALTLVAGEADWIANEALLKESSTVNIHIRLSSSAYPCVRITFEQYAGWEGKINAGINTEYGADGSVANR